MLSATGIILIPQNGEVLALGSAGFNNNYFNDFNPNYHRIKAITDQFEPGSTYKVVSAIFALTNDIVNLIKSLIAKTVK